MWIILPQVQRIKGIEFPVEVRVSRFRPASEKEFREKGKTVVPMRTTYSLNFSHSKDQTLVFRVTAQHRGGKWKFNLHEPPRQVPVQVRVDLKEKVFADTGEYRVKKETSGSVDGEFFFSNTLPKRVGKEFAQLVSIAFQNAMEEELLVA